MFRRHGYEIDNEIQNHSVEEPQSVFDFHKFCVENILFLFYFFFFYVMDRKSYIHTTRSRTVTYITLHTLYNHVWTDCLSV